MRSSSDRIGALAAALAKAQAEIANPEKSLTATIVSPFPREGQPDLSLRAARKRPRLGPEVPGGSMRLQPSRQPPSTEDSGLIRADHNAGPRLRRVGVLRSGRSAR